MEARLETSVHTGVLIAVIGLAAWVAGLPMLFPSLGPSAFVLAMVPDDDVSDPRRVVGGHTVGIVAGLFAYHVLAAGLVVTQSVGPLSMVSLRLAASGVVATVLTVAGMLCLGVRHPPACATTLIVALGLLSTLIDGAFIIMAVGLLIVAHRLFGSFERAVNRAGFFDH
jgi:CBS-domain-containing membrane protein